MIPQQKMPGTPPAPSTFVLKPTPVQAPAQKTPPLPPKVAEAVEEAIAKRHWGKDYKLTSKVKFTRKIRF